jgi:hypothetical protein
MRHKRHYASLFEEGFGMVTADPRRRALEAARQRRRRARVRQGLTPMQIDVHEDAVTSAMILSGRLTPEQTLRRQLVERECAKVLLDWARCWVKNVTA